MGYKYRNIRDGFGLGGNLFTEETIDKSIVCHINKLNELGYKTEFSCSGLDRDHTMPNFSTGAYISFDRSIGLEKERDIFECSIALGIEFNRSPIIFSGLVVAIYFNIYGGGQDGKILLIWDKVVEYLQKCCEKE